MHLNGTYRLSPHVVLRPETSFGGLLYHRLSNRLVVLSSPLLVDFLNELDGSLTIGEAIQGFVAERPYGEAYLHQLVDIMTHLEDLELIDEC